MDKLTGNGNPEQAPQSDEEDDSPLCNSPARNSIAVSIRLAIALCEASVSDSLGALPPGPGRCCGRVPRDARERAMKMKKIQASSLTTALVDRRGFLRNAGVGVAAAAALADRTVRAEQQAMRSTSNVPSMRDVTLANQHMLNTVRIEAWRKDRTGSVGTGFMHKFCEDESGAIQCVVTNAHVIDGTEMCELVFRSRKLGAENAQTVPSTIRFPKDFGQRWHVHPDETADLAVLPISNELRQMIANGFTPEFKATQAHHLLNADNARQLNAVEEVLMVGYPNGLWDRKNNLPVARTGITASPSGVDWNGRKEFLIDCAVYPGSSGSPVYLFSPSGTRLSVGHRVVITDRVILLGIVKSVFLHDIRGTPKSVAVPTTVNDRFDVRIPNDLGLCTRSDQLTYFEEYFRQEIEKGDLDGGNVVR